MGKAEKITLTRESVLEAFAEGRTFAYRPLGITDIARNIAEARGSWHDPFAVMSRAALVRLLDEMTEDGALVARTGTEWWSTVGVSWHDRRPSVRYWSTRERAEEWARKRAEEEEAAEVKRDAQEADRYAREHLVIRHAKEYEELIEEYHNGARLVDQER
jgi:hypothetical protein